MGVLKVFSLGDHGVNVTKDPLHTDVGDVVWAQNAYFSGSGHTGGLYKRAGLRQFNTTALNAAVMSIVAVDLTDATGAVLTDSALLVLTDDVFLTLTE